MPDARALYREGFAHFAAGRVDQALASYRRALELDPQLAIAWSGVSRALERQGQLDEAIEAARRVVELEPEDPLSHTNLSRLYMQNGMVPEAEEERAAAMRLQMKQGGSA